MSTTLHEPPHEDAATLHPLEPLSADEIREAVAILRAGGLLGEAARFVTIELREPAKEAVLDWEQLAPPREAFVILLDRVSGETHEAVVSLDDEAVVSFTLIPGVQPRVLA